MRVSTLFVGVVVALSLAPGVPAQEPTTAEGYLKRGDAEMAANFFTSDHTKAIADYTKAIELDGKLTKAFKQRAVAYTSSGKYKEAVDDYTAAIKLGNLDAESYLGRGRVYSYLGKAELAISDFTFVIHLDAKIADALISRAGIYIGQGKFDKATADYDTLVQAAPTVSNYYTRAGYHRWTRKDLKAALADYTAVIGLEPNEAGHYSSRAQLHAQNNDPDAAVADYTTALKLRPKDLSCLTARGDLYLKKGRTDDAVADYNAALAQSPTYSELYLRRAEAEKRKGNMEGATADFNKAVEYGPWHAGKVYLYQLNMLPDAIQFDTLAALTEAETAIKNKPKDARGYIRRAAVHSSWDYTKAADDYTTALKLAPERAAALHVCRGAAYQCAGRYASAVADYREALQLDPQMKLAESMLNAGIGKMKELKSATTVESVRLDEEVFFVKTSVERMTLPDGAKKTIKKTLTTRHEVTVADVRRLDVEVRASLKQKQESSSGNTSSSKSSESTTVGGGGSVGLGIFSFSGRGGQTWESGSETGYSSSTLTGWESEFGTSIRKGMESSRAFSSSVESSEEVSIEPIGKGKDQPFLVIYQDKYRSGTAKLKINGVTDEVRFAFPVGKDITWEYAEKPKTDDKK